MLQLLLLIVALGVPDPAPLLCGLDARDFPARQQASARLAQSLTWPLAVRLTLRPPADPEARLRVRRALDDYFAGAWEPGRPWPYIDALNVERPCEMPDAEFVSRYLGRARWAPECYGTLPDFRAATALLVADLRRCLVPPALTRGLLLYMERESAAWDARHRQRMPQSPEPPIAARP